MFYVMLGVPFFVLGILGTLVGGIWFYGPLIAWVFLFGNRYTKWVFREHQNSLSWGMTILLDICAYLLGTLAVVIFLRYTQ